MSHATLRTVLLAVLVVGAVGSVGPGTTYSLFTNAHDGTGTVSAADNINGGGNSADPTAEAGGPYTVVEDETVDLDASGSTSSQGNIRSYDWTIVSGAGDDSLSSGSGEEVTYNAPTDVSSDTTTEVRVTVTTNQGNTDTDTATVTVTDTDGCDASSLTFCSVDIDDQDTSYSVPYEVGDPNDEFVSANVTLIKSNNGKVRDTASSTAMADTLSVDDGNSMNSRYTVRVELYHTNGTVVECREATNDMADKTDPSVSAC